MSRIDELIKRLCPDGVEYKKLGEIIVLNFGERITKTSNMGTKFPVYGGGGESFRTDSFNREEEYVVSRFAMSPHCVRYVSGKFWMLDSGFTFNVVDDNKVSKAFVAQNLLAMQPAIYACSNQSAQKNLKTSKFLQFEIPVPPMEIQLEIVKVLDSFAELEARKAQYAYYRDKLFAECDSIQWVGLLDLATDCDRARKPIKQEERTPGATPYYGASGIVDYVEGFTHEGDYLLVSEDGANLTTRTYPIAFQIHGRNWVNNHAHVLQIDDNLERKLIEIYLNSISLEPYISKGAQPKLTKKKLGDVKVPVPSSADLIRIVGILEQFDVLTTCISQGLPAEVEARRRQYAYYRDKLLSFKEKVA